MKVPFFRPDIREAEIEEVVATLRSGWLTSGARVKRFEEGFRDAVGARHALAVNSCTAAMHLAVVALDLQPGDGVLVPTMTFAATAEVVRYCGAIPILVDCDPDTLHMSLEDAEKRVRQFEAGEIPGQPSSDTPGGTETQNHVVVGMLPVYVGGLMMPLTPLRTFAERHGLWVVEDAAHSFPASVDTEVGTQRCGEGTAHATCFSFYANKTITTGEGGMVVTESDDLIRRMRRLALHGLSTDAWQRYDPAAGSGPPRWDYSIVEAGFKYNLTDIAAAVGLAQLARAEEMREARERLAKRYDLGFAARDLFETAPTLPGHQHAWHLYPIRLAVERLSIDRNRFVEEMSSRGVSFSVHWRPLHLHPYYKAFGWRPEDLPQATDVWQRLVSLPLYPGMTDLEQDHVIRTVLEIATEFSA